jgi:hypothetical protein
LHNCLDGMENNGIFQTIKTMEHSDYTHAKGTYYINRSKYYIFTFLGMTMNVVTVTEWLTSSSTLLPNEMLSQQVDIV